jgi:amidohydrolase
MTAIEAIRRFAPDLVAIRRDIHAHPELGFEEHRTSALVAERLESFGCEVHRGVAKTGVVGRLKVGKSRRTVGLRADMDALPIVEINDLAYRSRHEGRMHACGHDGHTAMLLGAARHLAATRAFDGTVHFIFQPSEERNHGAAVMIEDGLFERFPCDAVFGMHNMPGLAAGKISTRPGPMMAGCSFFDIAVSGAGGHGAIPEATIDPVIVASHIATALQTIVSRNVRPFEPAVVTVTQIHAGDAYNVIPASAVLRGTARAFTDTAMALIGERIEGIARDIAAAFGATASTDYRVAYPPLVNHVAEARFVADVAAGLVGEANLDRNGMQTMASEDFSYMLGQRPGAFVFIGNGTDGGAGSCEAHNPGYDFNDAILPLGASLWVRLVEARLAKS